MDDANTQPTQPFAPQPSLEDISGLFSQIAEKIIEQQEAIIGPIAVQQAEQVTKLHLNWPQHQVTVDGDAPLVIDELVEQYKELFGQIAVQTCKDSVARYLAQLPPDQLPKSLR